MSAKLHILLTSISHFRKKKSSRHFYRAMHFSAKCGHAIACRLSLCLSVRLWRWWIVIT